MELGLQIAKNSSSDLFSNGLDLSYKRKDSFQGYVNPLETQELISKFNEEMKADTNGNLPSSNSKEKQFISEETINSSKVFTPVVLIKEHKRISKLKKLGKVKQKNGSKGLDLPSSTVNRADCIRKRIKTHFNNFLLKHLNAIIKSKLPHLRIKLQKLSQRFIADVKIESNKFYLGLPIREIYCMDFKEAFNVQNNRLLYSMLTTEENSKEILELFEKPYAHFYEIYLKSEFYASDLKKFHRKEGEVYVKEFQKHSEELMLYYRNGIPYKRRKFSLK